MIQLKFNKITTNFEILVQFKLFCIIYSKKSIVSSISKQSYNYLYVNKVLRSLGLVSSCKNKTDFNN